MYIITKLLYVLSLDNLFKIFSKSLYSLTIISRIIVLIKKNFIRRHFFEHSNKIVGNPISEASNAEVELNVICK